jgi:hypothetical protein
MSAEIVGKRKKLKKKMQKKFPWKKLEWINGRLCTYETNLYGNQVTQVVLGNCLSKPPKSKQDSGKTGKHRRRSRAHYTREYTQSMKKGGSRVSYSW